MSASFLNYGASEAAINEVRSFTQCADTASQGLRVHTQQIADHWEGTSATSFVAAMTEIQTSIHQAIDSTTGAATALASAQEQAHSDQRQAERREAEARRKAEQHTETAV